MTYETNANKLPWMQDHYGFVSNLRREGCRSIGRMMGDDAKMDVFMDTLKILAKYAAAKKVEQELINELARRRRVKQIDEVTKRNITNASIIERQLQSELDSVDSRLNAIRSRKEQAKAEDSITVAASISETIREKQQVADGIGVAKV